MYIFVILVIYLLLLLELVYRGYIRAYSYIKGLGVTNYSYSYKGNLGYSYIINLGATSYSYIVLNSDYSVTS